MKNLVLMSWVVWIASGCTGPGPGGLSGPDNCLSDSCLCPDTETCDHACSPGELPCRVVCSRGLDCNVLCAPDETCAVDASQAAGVYVDCGNSADCRVVASQAAEVHVDCANSDDCRVACPATGCTVSNCTGNCAVICGSFDLATHNGPTATCP